MEQVDAPPISCHSEADPNTVPSKRSLNILDAAAAEAIRRSEVLHSPGLTGVGDLDSCSGNYRNTGSHEQQLTTESYDYMTADYDYTATFDYYYGNNRGATQWAQGLVSRPCCSSWDWLSITSGTEVGQSRVASVERCTGVTGSRWTDEMMAEGKSEDSKDLLMVLQNILKKLQSKSLVSLNRRQSHLPPCDIGASCSVKKGPHFGELCECQRRSRNYPELHSGS
ncbi:hypothetical protein Q8A73_007328 [Channa argus]|nr:hypothetical protein Q8A73_007328 [Channa argus]